MLREARVVDAARGNVRQALGPLGIPAQPVAVERLVGGRSSAVYMLGFGSPIGIGRQGAKAPRPDRSDRSDRTNRVVPILAPWRPGGGSDLEHERTYVLAFVGLPSLVATRLAPTQRSASC